MGYRVGWGGSPLFADGADSGEVGVVLVDIELAGLDVVDEIEQIGRVGWIDWHVPVGDYFGAEFRRHGAELGSGSSPGGCLEDSHAVYECDRGVIDFIEPVVDGLVAGHFGEEWNGIYFALNSPPSGSDFEWGKLTLYVAAFVAVEVHLEMDIRAS